MLPTNFAAERFPAWLGAAAAAAAVAMAGRKLSAGDLLLTCAQLIARGAYAIATPQADRKFLRKCVAAEKAVWVGGGSGARVHIEY